MADYGYASCSDLPLHSTNLLLEVSLSQTGTGLVKVLGPKLTIGSDVSHSTFRFSTTLILLHATEGCFSTALMQAYGAELILTDGKLVSYDSLQTCFEKVSTRRVLANLSPRL